MRTIFFSFLVLCGCFTYGQSNKYFVYLKDKSASTFSISAPSKFLSERAINRRTNQQIPIVTRDLPVNQSYISQIKSTGAKILGQSKWFNAVLIDANATQYEAIKKLSFYKSTESNADIKGGRIAAPTNNKWSLSANVEYNYGNSAIQIQQLGVDEMHKQNYTGKGVLIGILDSGFQNANNLDFFKNIFSEKRIIDTWDFVTNDKNIYEDHNHGTSVLSCIAGFTDTKLVGTAPDASFVLYKTEDVSSETKIEEVYWLLGAERADSAGVDIINSSLGYSEFDNPAQNYTFQDLNGDKTIAARAADFAAAAGIVVVVSAGNEGNAAWKYIGTPADADSVLTVGAVDINGNVTSFSSFGPNAKKNIKPEVSARGGSTVLGLSNNLIGASNGTSFSSPLIAGMVAGIKQAFPFLSAMKIREFMIKSGSIYNTPNDRLGYGIPNFKKVAELAEAYKKTLVLGYEKTDATLSIYPNPSYESAPTIRFNNSNLNPKDKITIISNTGKIISSGINYEQFQDDYAKLSAGIYYVSFFRIGQKNQQLKFIKP